LLRGRHPSLLLFLLLLFFVVLLFVVLLFVFFVILLLFLLVATGSRRGSSSRRSSGSRRGTGGSGSLGGGGLSSLLALLLCLFFDLFELLVGVLILLLEHVAHLVHHEGTLLSCLLLLLVALLLALLLHLLAQLALLSLCVSLSLLLHGLVLLLFLGSFLFGLGILSLLGGSSSLASLLVLGAGLAASVSAAVATDRRSLHQRRVSLLDLVDNVVDHVCVGVAGHSGADVTVGDLGLNDDTILDGDGLGGGRLALLLLTALFLSFVISIGCGVSAGLAISWRFLTTLLFLSSAGLFGLIALLSFVATFFRLIAALFGLVSGSLLFFLGLVAPVSRSFFVLLAVVAQLGEILVHRVGVHGAGARDKSATHRLVEFDSLGGVVGKHGSDSSRCKE